MDTPYSIVAVKYVGFTPAQDAVDTLRELRKAGNVDLKDAVAVSRSADGELHYYPIQSITPEQGAVGLGAAGFALGLLFGRPLRWALLGAGVGLGVGTLSSLLRRQEVEATVPYLEKGESLLYMQIRNANWTAFLAQMRPYLDQGLMVVRRLAAAHAELEAALVPAAERQAATTEVSPAESAPEPDDFTAIKGIGPVISARLRDSGVRSFAQLAGMDVEQVAQIAGVSAARIVSGDWIGQAETLAASA